MNLNFWPFKKSQPPPPVQVQIVRRDILRIPIQVFRQDGEAVGQARKLLADPTLQNMLDVLHFKLSSLALVAARYTDPGMRVSMADKMVGYAMCLDDFRSLGEPDVPEKKIEADFLTEDVAQEFAQSGLSANE